MGQEVKAELPGRIQGQVGLLSPAPGPLAHCHRRLQAGQSTCGTWGSGGPLAAPILALKVTASPETFYWNLRQIVGRTWKGL